MTSGWSGHERVGLGSVCLIGVWIDYFCLSVCSLYLNNVYDLFVVLVLLNGVMI